MQYKARSHATILTGRRAESLAKGAWLGGADRRGGPNWSVISGQGRPCARGASPGGTDPILDRLPEHRRRSSAHAGA